MIGLSKNAVRLCPYSEEWKTLFDREKINIYNCIEDYIVDIQHVGSYIVENFEFNYT